MGKLVALKQPEWYEDSLEDIGAEPGDSAKVINDRGWSNRAKMSAQYARYAELDTCPTDNKELLTDVKDAIAAWTKVLKYMKG